MLGYVPLPVGEVYIAEDPPRMYKMIRQTERTCLAFKILAAGRLCDRQQSIEKAFQDTFAGIKTKDAVIVGMFLKWSDHIAINAEMVRNNPKWIRVGRDGSHPSRTPYNWVPMSFTQEGWYNEVVYKNLVMMKKLGYTDVFQDGAFGCLAEIDYTGGKAHPVQPYYWRYFRDIYRLGMRVNGECLIGWGNNTVGQINKEDMNHLWAYTHGIHRGNRAGNVIDWFTPEMQHQTYQLYIGTYINLESAQKHGDVARYVRKFLQDNGHPDRVFLEGLRQENEKWIWDKVWWEYNDGKRVQYPNYEEILNY